MGKKLFVKFRKPLVASLLSFMALQVILSMLQKSPTSDETPHLAAGYSYWKTLDFRLNPEHPPLIKLLAAIPLFLVNPDLNINSPAWLKGEEWSFGEEFIYNNRIKATTLIFLGRLPIVILGILLGIFVYRWSSEIYGQIPGLLSLVLYCFCPNILAHSGMVTFDLGITFFTLIALYYFRGFIFNANLKTALLCGIVLGCAFSTKFTAINILPIMLILVIISKLHKKDMRINKMPEGLKWGVLILAVAVVFTLLTYGIKDAHRYFKGLNFISGIVSTSGMPTFLFGKYSTTGWWYYFLAAFSLKTPVHLLLLFISTLFIFIINKNRKIDEYFMVIPILFFFAMSAFSKMQLGLRYILPVYPFIFILAGSIIKEDRNKVKTLLLIPLLLWYVISSAKTYPHYLAYFNELAGGSKNGYKCLIDSNIDWGQDLPGLKKYIDSNGNPELIFSFFGSAAPAAYDIVYQDFYSYNASGRNENHINSPYPSKEFLAMSANILQMLLIPDKHVFDWLKNKTPLNVIGHSIFVYDITNDDYTHAMLGVYYYGGNFLNKAEREFKRAISINPKNELAAGYLKNMNLNPWVK